jgi:hypothetical protein
MTCGIYKLTFGNSLSYVGKSNNIESRWFQHNDDMIEGRAAKKVQEAYSLYGTPKKEILFKCHCDHIDLMETIFIHKLKPALNSATTTYILTKDVIALEQWEEMLAYSTGEHLRLIATLSEEIHAINSFDYSAAQAKNIEQGEYLAAVLTELNKIKKRSLFQRIFNID